MAGGREASSLSKTASPGPGHAALADMDDAHVVAAYSRWAPFYDRSFGAITRRPSRMAVAEINALPPGRVLDLGVGTGISLPLYSSKHKIVGVDLTPHMLAIARRRVTAQRLSQVEALHEMDASQLTFATASFDVVVAMFVITVVPDPDRVLSEMIRVVKPGGRLILLNHFSPEKGLRAALERRLSRFSSRLGWRPSFPIARVLGRPELKLLVRRPVRALDLFTLLVFERL